jgi:hypothetical protein
MTWRILEQDGARTKIEPLEGLQQAFNGSITE